jgi:anaphase-promoting complex subunit 2
VLQTKEQIKARVLKPSKSTQGILLLYINLTKVMKILFNTIEVLESISEPIKIELRRRTDTFRCIINSIADDKELY